MGDDEYFGHRSRSRSWHNGWVKDRVLAPRGVMSEPAPHSEASPSELELRIVAALRAAGGSCQRTPLRNSLRPWTALEEFDGALAALAARGKITGELVAIPWKAP